MNPRTRFAAPVIALTLLVAIPAAAAATSPAKHPTFALRSAEIFNLVYQLDCLSDPHNDCAFAPLWKSELGWTAEDDQALERRKEIRGRYSGVVSIDEAVDDAPFMFDAARTLELKKKLILAAAGARDIADYRKRLELVVSANDAAELATLTERFLPRFRRFFPRVRPGLLALSREIRAQLGHAGLRRLVAQAMAFYEVPESASRDLEVELVALPPAWTGHYRGEQVEHLSVIEIKTAAPTSDEAARRGFTGTILLHELFHYFYGSAPGARARALASHFATADEPGAAAGYGLLNEALATIFSVLSRKAYLSPTEFAAELASGRPFYKDGPIDAAARAGLATVEAMLTRGESLYHPGFVPAYLSELRNRMGDTLKRPALKLRTLLMIAEDRELRPAMGVIQRGAVAGRALSALPLEEPALLDAWTKHAEQSGVILVRGKSMEKLRRYEPVLGRGIVERLSGLRARHRAFVQTVRRGRHSALFVLTADNPADFEKLAGQLMAAPAPFELLTLDGS